MPAGVCMLTLYCVPCIVEVARALVLDSCQVFFMGLDLVSTPQRLALVSAPIQFGIGHDLVSVKVVLITTLPVKYFWKVSLFLNSF